ncbi:MAG TPA: hypothetical protein DCD97_05530, partial [Firmicutes bacterium]|nr:hypothetical protein [Bacillota bacterium]
KKATLITIITASARGDILDLSIALSGTAFINSACRFPPANGSLKGHLQTTLPLIDSAFLYLKLSLP